MRKVWRSRQSVCREQAIRPFHADVPDAPSTAICFSHERKSIEPGEAGDVPGDFRAGRDSLVGYACIPFFGCDPKFDARQDTNLGIVRVEAAVRLGTRPLEFVSQLGDP